MRRCIFCGGGPVSREHTTPEWIHHILGPASAVGLWRPHSGGTHWRAPGRSGQGKIKLVCQPCNNGWLSDLEDRAAALMRPLILDISIPLSRESQATVALWCVKTAMVNECVGPRAEWFYTQQ